MTINAGAGRDTIINSGSNVVINSGGGSDYIEGFDEDDSLEGVTYNYLTVAGNDVLLIGDKSTVTVANGTVLERFIVNDKDISSQIPKDIYNDKSNIKISGSDNNDTIDNFGNKVTVTSGAGNDSLRNHGTHVLIEAGADDDTIEAYMIDKDSSSYTTLRGGAGNDHIDNHGHHALIDGGKGNDTLGNYTGDDNGIHEQYEADF